MQGGGVSDLAFGRPTSKATGTYPPDHHLTHLSPATHKHINLYGRYDSPRKVVEGSEQELAVCARGPGGEPGMARPESTGRSGTAMVWAVLVA